ncbi:hypothetical protein CRG98_040766 [Punica granatum]|uniref:Uncharacterized protein n=1 Tax=Punica granatum TaxID=22663 RepID=A0A2I0I4D6_PUNGR|nr:hypothetical protein CRG98_040766 [Punica granatum]
MKLSAKPISSPGRSDKFPPPLMRFLRSNVGSRSRGRSRASPMFLRKAQKSSSASVAAESTQEPSSPKVTCMGQVRVRRSKNKKPQAARKARRGVDDDRPGSSTGTTTTTWCAWISQALLCHRPGRKRWCRRSRSRSGSRGEVRRASFTRAWRDCSAVFHMAGCRRREPKTMEEDSPSSKVDTEPRFRNNSVRSELGVGNLDLKSEEEEGDEEVEARARTYKASSSPCSPPKNALLLTRCRSAPYRSSSLACRFWGSPLNGPDSEDAQRPQQNGGEEPAGEEEPKPLLRSEGEARVHPEDEEEEEEEDNDDEEKERFLKREITVSVAEKMAKPAKAEENKPEEEEGLRPPPPPRLTRCKSEPAITAAQKVGFR